MKTTGFAIVAVAVLTAFSPAMASTTASSSVSFALTPVGAQSGDLLVNALDVLLETDENRSGDGSSSATASSSTPFEADLASMSAAGTGTGDAFSTADAFFSFENIGAQSIAVEYELNYNLFAEVLSDGEANNDVFSLATLGVRGPSNLEEELSFDIFDLGSQSVSDTLRFEFNLDAGAFAEVEIFSEASTLAVSDTTATPAPIPLPATGFLLLCGVGGLLLKRRNTA